MLLLHSYHCYEEAYTTMGLLTRCVPSSQTREADTTVLPISPSTFTTNDNYCPREVNVNTLVSPLILSAGGAVTVALYVDDGSPTFVMVLLNVWLKDFKDIVERANEGRFRSHAVPFMMPKQVLLSPVTSCRDLVL